MRGRKRAWRSSEDPEFRRKAFFVNINNFYRKRLLNGSCWETKHYLLFGNYQERLQIDSQQNKRIDIVPASLIITWVTRHYIGFFLPEIPKIEKRTSVFWNHFRPNLILAHGYSHYRARSIRKSSLLVNGYPNGAKPTGSPFTFADAMNSIHEVDRWNQSPCRVFCT